MCSRAARGARWLTCSAVCICAACHRRRWGLRRYFNRCERRYQEGHQQQQQHHHQRLRPPHRHRHPILCPPLLHHRRHASVHHVPFPHTGRRQDVELGGVRRGAAAAQTCSRARNSASLLPPSPPQFDMLLEGDCAFSASHIISVILSMHHHSSLCVPYVQPLLLSLCHPSQSQPPPPPLPHSSASRSFMPAQGGSLSLQVLFIFL